MQTIILFKTSLCVTAIFKSGKEHFMGQETPSHFYQLKNIFNRTFYGFELNEMRTAAMCIIENRNWWYWVRPIWNHFIYLETMNWTKWNAKWFLWNVYFLY